MFVFLWRFFFSFLHSNSDDHLSWLCVTDGPSEFSFQQSEWASFCCPWTGLTIFLRCILTCLTEQQSSASSGLHETETVACIDAIYSTKFLILLVIREKSGFFSFEASTGCVTMQSRWKEHLVFLFFSPFCTVWIKFSLYLNSWVCVFGFVFSFLLISNISQVHQSNASFTLNVCI